MNPPCETRSFHYSDGKSDKFWIITLENNQHTVRYGRAGTQGQQQTKEFPTVEKARQSYEKLIREKIAKGYVEEQTQAQASIDEPTIAQSPAVTVSIIKEAEAIDSSPQPQQPVKSDLKKSIDLDPKDWFWATWRNLEPLERPKPKPFDLNSCLARLRKVTVKYQSWNWSKAAIEPVLSCEEAHFWFAAIAEPKMIEKKRGQSEWLKPEDLVEKLSHQSFDGNISSEQIKSSWHFSHYPENLAAETFPLVNLLPADDFISLAYQEGRAFPVLHGFRNYYLSYLAQPEIEQLRSQVRSRLDLNQWSITQGHYAEPSSDFYFAALLGLHDELLTLIESWSDDTFTASNQSYLAHYQRPQEIVFGLKEPHLVEHHLKRLGLKLQPPQYINQTSAYIRAWSAHTEFSALDLIRDTVLAAAQKEEAEEMLEAFALVKAPEAAPFMLELMLSSKAPQVARRWLNENLEYAIAGLVSLIGQRRLAKAPAGRLTETAISWLRSLKRQGYASLIQACIDQEPDEIAGKIRQTVLDFQEKEYTLLDDRTTPKWLIIAIASVKRSQVPRWIVLSDLPPVTIGEFCLNSYQVETLLIVLKQKSLDASHPLIVNLKQHVEADSLDRFAWRLFECWMDEGAPSKEKWAMMAVGLLGSDVSALKLAPLIREWPGESQHQRAVTGLECLRSIGTDTALMQINGLAQKVKFKGIKQRAQECMEAIAQDRNMTREQLEDRIVPDCELDSRGSRLFDFGARQFRFVLGADLKPRVKDSDGKVKPNLPNPTAKDDQEKAQAAIANWKLFKKQVSEVIKIQPNRLEQAMVAGRRWQVNEFELLLVQHPLMTHLTQRLIWGGYDASGQLTTTFRVTEDQTYADSNDETFNLTEVAQVGIVHPLHLTPEVRSIWGELLSDYEIVQPFVQLGRSLHSLEPGEETALEITRFKDLKVPIVALVRTLENLGWQRGILHDHGDYSLHFKYFSSAGITAVVGEYEEVFVDLSVTVGSGREDIDRCCFLRGRPDRLYDYPAYEYPGRFGMKDVIAQLIPLGEVDSVIISEVLRDLITVTAKTE